MRSVLAALSAAFALALSVPAAAQTTLSPEDRMFYGGVAERTAATAAAGDTAWSADSRAGTIRFEAGGFGCKTFVLVENPRPPAIGTVCPSGGAGSAFVASNVRYAAAAGPTRDPDGATRGIPKQQPSAQDASVRGRIVPLKHLQARIYGAGGHAIVLLTPAAALRSRNMLLCRALLENFAMTTFEQTVIGTEKERGELVRIRPIFWPLDDRRAEGAGDRCAKLMSRYDFVRAASILDKMELREPGPYLVVSRDDQRTARIINMARLTNEEIPPMVRFFRDSFSQKADIWAPAAQAEQRALVATFGAQVRDAVVAAIRPFAAGAASAARSRCFNDAQDNPCR